MDEAGLALVELETRLPPWRLAEQTTQGLPVPRSAKGTTEVIHCQKANQTETTYDRSPEYAELENKRTSYGSCALESRSPTAPLSPRELADWGPKCAIF